jgi:hypothetical protein
MKTLLASAAALALFAAGPVFAADQPGSANQSNLQGNTGEGVTPRPLGHSTTPTPAGTKPDQADQSASSDMAPQPMMKHRSQPAQHAMTHSKDSTPAEAAETQRLNEQALSKAGG